MLITYVPVHHSMEMLICKRCREQFDNVQDYTDHILEYSKPKQSSDFETPLMRDFSKVSLQIMFGLIGALGFIFLFLFPFGITEFCNHGMVTTSGSIVGMIVSDLTGVCV